MHPKWVIGLAIIFLLGTILSGILEMQYVGSGEAGIFHGLMTKYKEFDFSNPFIAIMSLIGVAWSYIKLVWSLFWWDYSFFYGDYEILRYLCWTISIGIIVSLILSVTRGTSST